MSANALYTALLAAQRSMGPVKKDATNPAFRTKYATLQSVLETIEGPLSDNGLVLLQRFEPGEGGPVLITEIVHAETGDRISSTLPIVSKDPSDPQKLGGAITYARRFSLLALLGLSPEDDDGNAAAQPRQQAQSPAPRPPAQHKPVERAQEAQQPAPPTWTKDEYAGIVTEAWALSNAYGYERAVSHFGGARARMTPDQVTDTKEELRQITAAIAERTAQ